MKNAVTLKGLLLDNTWLNIRCPILPWKFKMVLALKLVSSCHDRQAWALEWLDDANNPLLDPYHKAVSHCVTGAMDGGSRLPEWDDMVLWKGFCEVCPWLWSGSAPISLGLAMRGKSRPKTWHRKGNFPRTVCFLLSQPFGEISSLIRGTRRGRGCR
jgi:hypothetical protein